MLIAIVSLGLMGGSARAASDGPTVTGNPQVGQTLTADPVVPGDTVSWYTCDSSGTLMGLLASDTDTYMLQESDLATDVCATDNFVLGPLVSAPVAVTIPVPTISGDFVASQTLATPDAAVGESYTVDYQWQDCDAGLCSPISGATDLSYTLKASDVGQQVQVLETPVIGSSPAPDASATSTDGQTVDPSTSTSTPTPTPGPSPTPTPKPSPTPSPTPKDSSAPAISGTLQLGQTLTAEVQTSPAASSYSYQWLRCTLNCTAISGAVGVSYELDDSDVGDAIAVTVTPNDGGAATSARTRTVTAPSTLQIVASPSAPLVNQPVTIVGVVTSTAAGTDPSGTIAFANGGSPISGCAAVEVPASGQTVTVSCTTGFPVSSPSLSASFTPSAGSALLGSSASTMSLVVHRGYSTTALDVPAKVLHGASTTFTASVAAARDHTGPVLPTGTVMFTDHGRKISGCRAVAIMAGGATCTIHDAHAGTQAIRARYNGDSNFHGSSSRVKDVRVTAPPTRRTTIRGTITATMQWTFHYTPSFTQIIAFVIHGAHPGATVTVQCSGRGCPFRSRAHAVTTPKRCTSTRKHPCPAPGTIGLEPSFHRRNLRVGATVTIKVTQKHFIGKYYRFSVRARRQPSVKISCLAAGSGKPGVGCSAP